MIGRAKESSPAQLCGEDCRYRKLYEGSQRSLSDMASRQAQAISRVGRLRNQLVLAAKRAFPKSFGEAERSVGKRLSEVPDEVLVGYLESFMGASVYAEESAGVAELREALVAIGVPIPTSMDLADWAAAVHKHAHVAQSMLDVSPVLSPRVDHAVPAMRSGIPNRDVVPSLAGTLPGSVRELEDIFTDVGADQITSNTTAATNISQAEAKTAALIEAGDMFDESPFDDPFTPAAPDSPLSGSMGTFDDMFDSAPSNDPFTATSVPGSDLQDFGFGEDDLLPNPEPAAPEPPVDVAPVRSNDTVVVEPPTTPQPAALPSWAGGRTMRPQLFPAQPTSRPGAKRERKTIKTKAVPAGLPDVPIENVLDTNGEIPETVRDQILAACAVPRPVFTSDLVAMLGNESVVDTWRHSWQDGDLTVRFVLPKPRHRLRGALVVPQQALKDANSTFSSSWWARCMEAFRGARLYELGVFFHRFAEQVISFDHDGDVVAVRMTLPSGLTGAILVGGQNLGDDGETRANISVAMERFLKDRLVHIAVLVMNAEQFEATTAAVEEEARKRSWKPAMPVTISRSWEYVDGTGTAIPVLGM
jgi:hypothetical protein